MKYVFDPLNTRGSEGVLERLYIYIYIYMVGFFGVEKISMEDESDNWKLRI